MKIKVFLKNGKVKKFFNIIRIQKDEMKDFMYFEHSRGGVGIPKHEINHIRIMQF